MPDVVLLSSVFGQIKIAEPMGACILAAHLRARGRSVEILEPSVYGWSVEETVDRVAERGSPIVGISMLRDKNVHDVLKFASQLRTRCPDTFIVMGGHGPSISLADIPNGIVVGDYLNSPDPWLTMNAACRPGSASSQGSGISHGDRSTSPQHAPARTPQPGTEWMPAPCSTNPSPGHGQPQPGTEWMPAPCSTNPSPGHGRPQSGPEWMPAPCSTNPSPGHGHPRLPQAEHAPTLIPLEGLFNGPAVDPGLNDRGKGPADLSRAWAAPARNGYGPRKSTYYDVTPEYLAICREIDAVMIGESDTNFPLLVDRVLRGTDWHDIPGVAYVDDWIFHRNPLPEKIRDLDSVPFMARDVLKEYQTEYHRSVPASILASRGCFYRCTFCSVVKYERLQTGINHRQRSNENLIAEIQWLHDTYATTVFNFEDDNFVVKNKAGFDKIHELCDRILQLPFKISFAFFCRADVVQQELFEHLRQAGLYGIYFGLESVYEGDLDFFHKGLTVEQMFAALDTLERVGFSARVGADLRVMLGYITWHPLTSFESLRASSAFIRRYQAPPKLLRRKLRVYAGTEVIRDVAQLGLLDAHHPDGWRFKNPALQGLDTIINKLFLTVNLRRDMLRTLEKAARAHGYELDATAYTRHRRYLDAFLCDQFDRIVDAAQAEGAGSALVDKVLAGAHAELDEYLLAHDVVEAVRAGYRVCGFDTATVDLFRK